MRHQQGFTVIELLVTIALVATASILFFVQKNNIEAIGRDTTRKTAINAMYYGLEEVYHKQHGNYPRTLTPEKLPSVDPNLFTDPNGVKLGQTTKDHDGQSVPVQADYRYEGLNCNETSCKSYVLKSTLENEADFIKESRSN